MADTSDIEEQQYIAAFGKGHMEAYIRSALIGDCQNSVSWIIKICSIEKYIYYNELASLKAMDFPIATYASDYDKKL
jgi:hypothetical protein